MTVAPRESSPFSTNSRSIPSVETPSQSPYWRTIPVVAQLVAVQTVFVPVIDRQTVCWVLYWLQSVAAEGGHWTLEKEWERLPVVDQVDSRSMCCAPQWMPSAAEMVVTPSWCSVSAVVLEVAVQKDWQRIVI